MASPLAPYAFAAQRFGLTVDDMLLGHLWSWLENQVTAAIKLVPLGQTQGQQTLLNLGSAVTAAYETGLHLDDEDIGYSAPAMALACSRHETQYTRLFRS